MMATWLRKPLLLQVRLPLTIPIGRESTSGKRNAPKPKFTKRSQTPFYVIQLSKIVGTQIVADPEKCLQDCLELSIVSSDFLRLGSSWRTNNWNKSESCEFQQKES